MNFDVSIYEKLVRQLLSYREFRYVFSGFRYFLFAIIAVMIVLVVLHVLFMLGRQSPLYKKKTPKRDWDKKFYPSVAILILIILLVIWALHGLLQLDPLPTSVIL